MHLKECENKFIYVIDEKDRIISVSDNWLLFAQENDATANCHPDTIINNPIWDYITGLETQHLFKVTLEKVRTTDKSVVLPFRCDAPDRRRYLELLIKPVDQKWIEFTSYIIREELRDTLELLEADTPRSDDVITMCSMCKKIKLSCGNWVEVEIAVATLKLFEQLELPLISHGLCIDCFEAGIAALKKLGPGPPDRKPSAVD